MKPTRFKDNLRNIKKQFVSWVSIVVIACLAATAFLGIRFSAESLRGNVNQFYEDTSFRDAEILGTLYLSEENLEEISHLPGVKAAVGVRRFDTRLDKNGRQLEVTVLSETDAINRPILLEGRAAADRTECLIEKDIADTLDLHPGDSIEVPPGDYILENTYTVAGIVAHPDHPVLSSEVPGNRYILVDMENFSAEAYDKCYSGVEVVFEKKEGTNRFSEQYFENITPLLTQLEEIGKVRAGERFDFVHDRYQKAIDEGQAELDKAAAQLSDARKELDQNHKRIQDSENELAEGLKTLKETEQQLTDAHQQLTDAFAQLNAGKSQLDSARSQLQSTRNELVNGYEEALNYRAMLQSEVDAAIREHSPENAGAIQWATSRSYDVDSSSCTMKRFPIAKGVTVDLTSDLKAQLIRKITTDPDETADITAALADVDTGTITKKAKKWESGHNDYLSGRNSYNAALSEYNQKREEYENGIATYEEGKAQYEAGIAAYNQGMEELNAAKEEIAAKEKEYDDALAEYENGVEELEDVRNQMENIPESRWVVMGAKGNSSYVYTKALAGNFANISSTFSLLFVFVGALVIYATVGKIVDEQRKQVGTTKALGFFNREVMAKYLTFGLSAALLGTAAGIALSYFVVEKAILGMEIGYYHIGEGRLIFENIPALLAVALAVVLTAAAVLFAGGKLVRTPAIRLMQDAAPVGGKKKKRSATDGTSKDEVPTAGTNQKEEPTAGTNKTEPPADKKNKTENAAAGKKSLYARLILRNMKTDLRRVIVTIVSVAGSCALMVIGLTISHSMSSAIDIQFDKIYRYDYLLDYDISQNENVEEEVGKILKECGAEYIRVSTAERPFLNGDELDSTALLCGDPEELSEYISFETYKTGETVTLDSDGIYVPQKLEENGGFVEKGKITLYDGTMKPYEVKTAGVFMSYIARFLVISEKGYRRVFGEKPVYNELLIRAGGSGAAGGFGSGASFENLKTRLEKIEGVRSFIRSEDRKSNFESYIGIADGIVILLTVMSFVMAYFILLNLVSMLVNQKKKELTVMRINGFTVREVKAYVGREMILTTVLGILLGIAAGSALAYRIILLLENINCFDRRLYYPGWGIAAAVTALLSLLISMFALRKVRRLSLTDVA